MAEAQSIFIPKISPGDLAALDYWTPNDAIFASGAPSPPGAIENAASRPVLVFPFEGTDFGYVFDASMGEDYGGGIITFDIYWFPRADVAAGSAVFIMAIVRENPGSDFLGGAAPPIKTATSAAPATSKGIIQKATIMFSNAEAGGIQPGDPFFFVLQRTNGDPADDLATDALGFRVNMKALP